MNLPERFISCDWGTSNLRIRQLESATLEVLLEYQTDGGIKKGYELYKKQSQYNQEEFFTNMLLEELKRSGIKSNPNDFIVASGMLSSSIGLKELDYAFMPLSFNGEELLTHEFLLDHSGTLLLVSGARTQSDVMRGEETQAIGLSGSLPPQGEGILLLPGTHSKHLHFKDGRFIEINTFMTGEIFDLFVNHSILSSSVKGAEWDINFRDVFLQGIQKGLANGLMSSLFSIRVKNLIENLIEKNSAEKNYYYLSGLLIGSELAHLGVKNETVYLAASGMLNKLYSLALDSFVPQERSICFDADLVDKAVLTGQRKILESYV